MNDHTAGPHPLNSVTLRDIAYKTLKTHWNHRESSCYNGSVLLKITLLIYLNYLSVFRFR